MSSGALPFTVRRELDLEQTWGVVTSNMRRYQIDSFSMHGIAGVDESLACVHNERASLMVRIGGVHSGRRSEQLVSPIERACSEALDRFFDRPARYVQSIVSRLEHEYADGLLRNTYVTATLLVVVDDCEVWTWHTSPQGIACGGVDGITLRSTDLRVPVLRQLGVLPPAQFTTDELAELDRASSIFCVGTEPGYETLRIQLVPGEVVIALDRALLPFGPLSDKRIPCGAFWRMDAGWQHGLAGKCVVAGRLDPRLLSLPDDFRIRRIA